MRIFWAVLKERSLDEHAVDALLDVATFTAGPDAFRISLPYMRTDNARNMCVDGFMAVDNQEADDTLIMLDSDHIHPPQIVRHLAARQVGVVGALAFRRGKSSDPLFFIDLDGQLTAPARWERGKMYECDFVGTGAIAIKRWVFDKLLQEGADPPFFRIEYKGWTGISLGEDYYFATLCKKHGIKHHCDTSIEIPHMHLELSTNQTWESFRKDHPTKVQYVNPKHTGIGLPNIKTKVRA